MASLSQQGVITPPSAARTAALYALVEKQVAACLLKRHARAADLAERAASHAEAMYAPDSLVFASLRAECCQALFNIAGDADGDEQLTLLRRAADVLSPVIALVLRRLEANTLLPGTVREEELDYDVRVQTAACLGSNNPVPEAAALREWCVMLGTFVPLFLGSHNACLPGRPRLDTTCF